MTSSAFRVNTRVGIVSKSNSLTNIVTKQNVRTSMTQIYQGIQRDEEDEEYFESAMDRASFSEKLPLALGVLGGISLPFIVGLIYLYANK